MSASARLFSIIFSTTVLLVTGCPPAAEPCTTDRDCPGDQLCIDRVCRHTCNSNADCAAGERCQQGYCAPAGDAAASDAVVGDRGTGDRLPFDRPTADRPGIDRGPSDRVTGDHAVPDGAIACDDSYCFEHGECWVTGGDIVCQCFPGYAQPRCETCADGYQDRDGDGTCLPDCAHAGLSCAQPHTRCSDSDGIAGCDCVVGYEDVNGVCEWSGGPLDPGFQQSGAWTVEGNATVDTATRGVDDPGRGYFPEQAACAGGGALSQTIEMPALADAEPLVLRFWLRSEGFTLLCLMAKLVVVVNGGEYGYWLPGSTWSRRSICLGARAYGGPLEIRFEVADACSTCEPGFPFGGTVPTFEIDNAVIEPASAGECPAVGSILNPDFEQGPVGWTPTSSDGGSAGVSSGAGTGGSWAGQLATSTICDQAALAGRASLPLAADAPSSALQLRARGGVNDLLSIGLNRNTVAQVAGTGAFELRRVCLLDSFMGLTVDLDLSLYAPGETCGDPGRHAFVVDDLSLLTEPACPANALIFDPGFENAVDAPQLAPSWSYSTGYTASAIFHENSDEAHGGNVSARLVVGSACGSAAVSSHAIVPAADSSGGPAIKLWYRAPTLSQTQLWFGQPLTASASYAQAIRCLDPSRAGRIVSVSINLNDVSGASCGSTYTPETAWIDDVEVTTDASCTP
ncbi:MAG: hypothetical protein JXR83_15580 [Deltaproteobacteria bacterium]|nr:hypothetical protein [Deltaproteobacteria bacterium]